MDCYVGAASGALKGLDFTVNKFKNLNVADIKRLNPNVDEITAMCFYDGADAQSLILTCHRNRRLSLFDSKSHKTIDLFEVGGGKGIINGIQTTSDSSKIITGLESGELSIWNASNLLELSSENIANNLQSWSCGNQLNAIRLNPLDENLLASGGVENPLKVWDLSTGKAIFIAKNVRHDSLELRVPVWETNMRFFGNDGKCIVTTTKKHYIRIYDTRVQRRPMSEVEWLDEPINALSTCCREKQVLVGNTRGELGLFDLRANNKLSLDCKFRGFAGSIRSIDAHPTEPIFASCGIDRFVIVHNINTREIVKKIFCKVQLNSVLLCKNNSLCSTKKK